MPPEGTVPAIRVLAVTSRPTTQIFPRKHDPSRVSSHLQTDTVLRTLRYPLGVDKKSFHEEGRRTAQAALTKDLRMKNVFFNAFSLWVLPGLIAGTVFLVTVLVAGALATTPWAMPDAIAQTIGMAAPAGYGFALVPVLVGIAVHLALSIGLCALFTACARGLRLHGWILLAAAGIFITIETPVALWGVMHTLLPATTFQFFLAAIPWWGSVLGHYLYALVLGLLLALSPFIAPWKPRRPHSSRSERLT
jgi:hypothetical protein